MTTSVIVNAGDDYIGDRAVALPPAAVDISSMDLVFTVAERVSGDVVIMKTSDYAQITVDTYLEGVALVELDGIDTLFQGNGPLNYELTGVDYDAREHTLVQGRFYITTGNEAGS